MKKYVRIDNGVVVEFIAPMLYDDESPDWVEGEPSRIGQEIPIEKRFTQELIETFVDITSIKPSPELNWGYENGVFKKPSSAPVKETVEELKYKLSLIDSNSVEMIRKFVLGGLTEEDRILLQAKEDEYQAIKEQISTS